MATKLNSLSHTKWLCKYHIVFTPKYRRKIIYNQYRIDLRDIIKRAHLKYTFGNRHFWSEGYYVSTVGLNEATIKKYIQNQEKQYRLLHQPAGRDAGRFYNTQNCNCFSLETIVDYSEGTSAIQPAIQPQFSQFSQSSIENLTSECRKIHAGF